MKVNCEVCGESFNRKPKDIKRAERHYCSKKCYGKGRKDERLRVPGVYAIVNILNFKIYCGASYDIVTRVYQHFTDNGRSAIKKLHDDMNLVGREFFHSIILEVVEDPNLLRERELWWIKELDADYNTFGRYKSPKSPKLSRLPKIPKPIRIKKIKEKKVKKAKISKPPKARREFGKPVSLDETLQMIIMYNNGMTWFQISEACDIPQASVKYRVCRYKATLED